MSQYLFVYGTLDPEHAPAEIAPAVAKLRPVGRASVQGVLYDFGEYPGAVFDGSPRRKIPGTVFRIPDDPEILRRLDEYEGFTPSNPSESLFIRELRPVQLTDGRVRCCWVYAYNRHPGTAQIIRGSSRKGRSRPVPQRRAAS